MSGRMLGVCGVVVLAACAGCTRLQYRDQIVIHTMRVEPKYPLPAKGGYEAAAEALVAVGTVFLQTRCPACLVASVVRSAVATELVRTTGNETAHGSRVVMPTHGQPHRVVITIDAQGAARVEVDPEPAEAPGVGGPPPPSAARRDDER